MEILLRVILWSSFFLDNVELYFCAPLPLAARSVSTFTMRLWSDGWPQSCCDAATVQAARCRRPSAGTSHHTLLFAVPSSNRN